MTPAPQSVQSRRELLRRLRWNELATAAAAEGHRPRPTRASDIGRATAMRTRDRRQQSPPVGPKSLPNLPYGAIIALNRMGFGPARGDIPAFTALGATDEQRLQAYVDQQLNPASIPDTQADARLAAAGFTTLNKTLAQLWHDHVATNPDWSVRMRPYWETERATFLRAVYSKRQLVEVLADFWHNHFNVLAYEYRIGPVFVHYDRDVIRGNMLGNFRDMLEDVAMSTAMLFYLDNYTSTNAGPNENFTRELFELHTMGAENYLGVMRQIDVPLDGQGRPIGYVDDDVFEATRCFTGWSVDYQSSTGNTGLFLYRQEWHDRFQKHVLGTFIAPDQPDLRDGRDVLDLLAQHPGTGRHIARKLCQRLISDDPPQTVVDQAAAVFTAHHAAPDQLSQVVRTILLSDEFLATWGEKIKRPFEIAVSAMRAGAANWDFSLADGDTDSFLYRFDQAGQPLFSWPAPNGYSDSKEDWQSATPRVLSWRMSAWLMDITDDADNFRFDVLGQTPPSVRSANALADFWILRILGRYMPPEERQQIVDFMAQGHNPDFDLPLDADDDTRDRLRTMVGLIFMSPSFLWR